MVSQFSKQLIEEIKKSGSNRFDDEFYQYVKLIEQDAPPADAPPPADPGGVPPPMGMGMPGAPRDVAPPPPKIPTNKSYPEILVAIAKALTININQEPSEDVADRPKALENLKTFVGETLEGIKTAQMDNEKALAVLDIVMRDINSITGNIQEIE